MEKEKVYTYTRVSTAMQIDGYSLEAQKNRIKAFADYSQFNIVHEYEDAGKSGKSIDGRIEFQTMLNDIISGKIKYLMYWFTNYQGLEEMLRMYFLRFRLCKTMVSI